MKATRLPAFIFAALLVSLLNLHAITIQDLVGVYIGKRTTTYPDWVERNDEITVIDADGLVTNYVFVEGLPDDQPFISQGYLELNEDGSFLSGETGVGLLSLHGNHLSVTVHFEAQDGFPSFPEATVHFQGRRTNRAGDFEF